MKRTSAQELIDAMQAHHKFMTMDNIDEIKELLEYTHKFLNKRLKIEGNLLIYPYDDTMEEMLINGLDISPQMATIIVRSWEEKTLGDFYGVRYANGNEYWRLNGRAHTHDDTPALIVDNLREWHKYGYKHRDNDMPAVIYDITDENCRKEWWTKGKLHRAGNPAIIDRTEIKYYIYGQEVNEKFSKLFIL